MPQVKHNVNLLTSKTQAFELLKKYGLEGHAQESQAARHQLKALLDRQEAVPDTDKFDRRDLRHLRSYAIDGRNTDIVDDAVSYEASSRKIYLHIADPSRFFLSPENDPIVVEALRKVSTVYTGFTTAGNIDMLPSRLTEDFVSLCGPHTGGRALSFGFRVLEDGSLSNMSIEPSLISFPRRMTFGIADHAITNRLSEELTALNQSAIRRRKYRGRKGAEEMGKAHRSSLSAVELVSELSLVAGEVAARYAHSKKIAVPFRVQAREGRKLKSSEMRLQASPHHGLGLDRYLQVTSPLRRSIDLIAHFQIKAQLRGESAPFLASRVYTEIGRVGNVLRNMAAYGKEVRFGKAGLERKRLAIAQGRVRSETIATKSSYVISKEERKGRSSLASPSRDMKKSLDGMGKWRRFGNRRAKAGAE